jgi:hypothetical protein
MPKNKFEELVNGESMAEQLERMKGKTEGRHEGTKVYHGTSEKVARAALKSGILRRDVTGSEGNWDHTVPSGSDRVYLTQGYAPYFASQAAGDGEKWGIIEVDLDTILTSGSTRVGTRLSPWYANKDVVPDEDWLEQSSRGMTEEQAKELGVSDLFKGFPWEGGMVERTSFFRDNPHRFSHLWDESLSGLGNVAVMSDIPARAITRVSIYDPKSNPTMTVTALDPMISTMNWKICAIKYRELSRWFMGYSDIDCSKLFRFGSRDDDPYRDSAVALNELEKLLDEAAKEGKDVGHIKGQIGFYRNELEREKAWEEEVIPDRGGIEVINPYNFGTGDMCPAPLPRDAILEKALAISFPHLDGPEGTVSRQLMLRELPGATDDQLREYYNMVRSKVIKDLGEIYDGPIRFENCDKR